MHFESGGIYHIFNQGNNRQTIFYSRETYLFFLRKIRRHVLPFGNLLAYCLMPNHFHLMLEVIRPELPLDTHRVTPSHPVSNFSPSHPVSKSISLNRSIAIILRSYTRAINNQKKRSGALFREGTKAVCLNPINGVSPSWQAVQGAFRLNISVPEREYPQVCFNYIHFNPVAAGLAKSPEDWEFSSFRDISGLRNGTLVNMARINDLGLEQMTHPNY
jgi:putative transposase